MEHSDARRLTDRIRLLYNSVQDQLDRLAELVVRARDGGAWRALGYATWESYVAAEFPERPRLETASRRRLVELLTDRGASSRTIAPFAGVSDRQVRKLAAGGNSSSHLPTCPPVDAVEVEGIVTAPATISVENVTTMDTTISVDNPVSVTGLDGRTYPRPVPRTERVKPRRSPLSDAYWRAVFDLQKSVERLERLHADDRFARNRVDLQERNGMLGDLSARVSRLSLQLMGRWTEEDERAHCGGDR